MADRLALLALGANLSSSAGLPADALRAALARISGLPGVRMVAVSRFWRTPAHPAGSGPDYVNACAAVRVGMPPPALLARLHEVEAAMGRERGTRWAARGIDIDLLAMGDTVAPDAATQDRWRALPPAEQAQLVPGGLILPHPRIQDRAFVLAPLAEIAPRWTHPRTGQDAAAMLAALGPGAMAGARPLA